jgi:hypothetical protein
MNDTPNDKEFPSADDPIGTRYVRDGDGDLIIDRRGERESRLRNILVYVALGLILLLTIGSIVSAVQQEREADAREVESQITDFEIRESQRANCEAGGNQLRADIRAEFVDLKEEILIPVFSEVRDLMPPTETTYRILNDAVERMERRIDTIRKRIPDNDCPELYPLLDDPRTERDEEGL